MKIRTKLHLFALLTIAGIAVIGGISLVGMLFIQGKLHVLTERSTPYQLKTIELQRAMQEHTSNLLQVTFATNSAELLAAREASEKSENELTQRARDLRTLTESESTNTVKVDGLTELAREIIANSDGRLKAEEAAKAADMAMKKQLSDVNQQLDQLTASMNKLQKGSSRQLSVATDKARDITQKLVNLTLMRDSLKDINFAFLEIQKAEGRKPLLLLRSRLDTALGEFAKNRLTGSTTEAGVKSIIDRVAEIKRQGAGLIEQRGLIIAKTATDEQKQSYEQLVQGVGGQLNSALIEIEQQITIATDRYSIENKSHDHSLKESTAASDTLSLTSGLIATCFEINSRARELFGARSRDDLEKTATEVRASFAAAEELALQLRRTLATSGAKTEAKVLGEVSAALTDTAKLLFDTGGVLERLGQVLDITRRSLELNSRLKNLVAEQRRAGEQGVNAAQDEQAKAVSSVNGVVVTNIATIALVGLSVLILAIVASALLARSITRPIKELTTMAEQFGDGDFGTQLDDRRKDEFGQLATHFNGTAARLQDITTGLRTAIDDLATNSRDLLRTADELSHGAKQQADQV
ncbi:MAG TPA: HAMP domain-containing protein, partial [Accumulibacter sp.]|nr:HAMP domain-containing protein [Accumulibacter sp.]